MARISEINFRDAIGVPGASDDFVEIAIAPGEDPTRYSLHFFDVNGVYLTESFPAGITYPYTFAAGDKTGTADAETGEDVYTLNGAGVALGTSPDQAHAVALVDNLTGAVIEFYDLEDSNGPYSGWPAELDATFSGATATVVAPSADTTTSINFEPDGTVYYIAPNSGDVLCFGKGTLIQTPLGVKTVETLVVGDEVTTIDLGNVAIEWIGSWPLKPVPGDKSMAIKISANALGPNVPAADCIVSRQHRIMIASHLVQAAFGYPEILVPAANLLGLPGVEECAHSEACTFYHLYLGSHQIVLANEMPSETLLLGPVAYETLTTADIADDWEEHSSEATAASPARPVYKGKRVKDCVENHIRLGIPMLETWVGMQVAA